MTGRTYVSRDIIVAVGDTFLSTIFAVLGAALLWKAVQPVAPTETPRDCRRAEAGAVEIITFRRSGSSHPLFQYSPLTPAKLEQDALHVQAKR